MFQAHFPRHQPEKNSNPMSGEEPPLPPQTQWTCVSFCLSYLWSSIRSSNTIRLMKALWVVKDSFSLSLAGVNIHNHLFNFPHSGPWAGLNILIPRNHFPWNPKHLAWCTILDSYLRPFWNWGGLLTPLSLLGGADLFPSLKSEFASVLDIFLSLELF